MASSPTTDGHGRVEEQKEGRSPEAKTKEDELPLALAGEVSRCLLAPAVISCTHADVYSAGCLLGRLGSRPLERAVGRSGNINAWDFHYVHAPQFFSRLCLKCNSTVSVVRYSLHFSAILRRASLLGLANTPLAVLGATFVL